MQMHLFGRHRDALANIGQQSEQHLTGSGDRSGSPIDLKQVPARDDGDLQALLDQMQMFVEWAAQLRQLARIGGFERELNRFSNR